MEQIIDFLKTEVLVERWQLVMFISWMIIYPIISGIVINKVAKRNEY